MTISIFVCLIIFVVHVFWAFFTNEPHWASRSGSAIVAVGLLLESWKIIKTQRKDDMPFWVSQAGHSALRASILIIIVGTIIQGYADMVLTMLLD